MSAKQIPLQGATAMVTYRPLTHTPTVSGLPAASIDDRSRSPDSAFTEKIKQYVLTFVMVHYFLWGMAMGVVVLLAHYFISVYAALLLLLAYLPSFLSRCQYQAGRVWHALRQAPWLWWPIQRYARLQIVRTAELDPQQQYVFGVYPHGILILSRVATYGGVFERLFPGIETRVLGASPMFSIPGARELCLWMGAVDAAKKVAVRVLQQKGAPSRLNASGRFSLFVYPGGSKEIFATAEPACALTEEQRKAPSVTTLITRTGFIRLAIQNGCSLVPVFMFNEHHAYQRVHFPAAFSNFMLNVLRTPLLLFFGRFFTWIPLNDVPLTMVYGAPIAAPKVEEPSDELVQEYYTKFHSAIRELYEKHRLSLGYKDSDKLVLEVEEGKKGGKEKKQD